MAVEIYKGQFVTAESATKYIDTKAILEGCEQLKIASENVNQTNKKLINAKDFCTRDKLMLSENTYDTRIDNCGSGLINSYNYIQDLTESILISTQRALDKKQLELNEIAREEEERIRRLRNDEETI